MPTDASDPLAAARAWIRTGAGRLRQWLIQAGPWGRLLLMGLFLIAVLAIGYLAGQPEHPTEMIPIFDGHGFTLEEAGGVARELEARLISARVVRGRVEVPHDRLVEAHAILKKLGMAPASLHEIAAKPVSSSLLSSPAQIESDRLWRREKLIEAAIRKLDDRLAAYVQIRDTPPRGLAPKGALNVTVYLDVEEDHPLPPSLIERIERVVRSLEPDLVPETGLWICDSQGNPHRMPGAPALEQQSRQRARTDQLRADIEQQLTWIPSVRVAVRIEDAEPRNVPAPLMAVPIAPTPVPPPPVIVSVNQPPEEDAEPLASDTHPSPTPPPPAMPKSKVFVVVWVPGEYYRKQASILRLPSSTPAELGPLASRTEDLIRKAVDMVVPANELGELTVERIPATSSEEAPAPSTSRGVRGRWPSLTTDVATLGGVTAGMLIVLVVAGARFRAGTRVSRRPAVPPSRRSRIDMLGLAPAERARELVRLDPAAASGVLQRWIGQGGPEP